MTEFTYKSWERQRASLNHDWLKNRFLTGLDAARNLLNGRARGEAYLSYLLKDILMDWDAKRPEVAELVLGFADRMSPKQLVDLEPLRHADAETSRRCRDVAHQLWLGRYPVTELIASAYRALEEADIACQELRRILCRETDRTDRAALVAGFGELGRTCRVLAKSLEAFPRTVPLM